MRLCPKCNSKTFNSTPKCDCGYSFVNDAEPSITCSMCGTENPATQVFCYNCTHNLHIRHAGARYESTKKPPNYTSPNQSKTREKAQSNNDSEFFSLDCLKCKKGLRIRLPQLTAAYRCPTCKSEFKIKKAQEQPAVFVIEWSPDLPPSSKPKSQLFFSPEIREALAKLGLEGEPSFDEVRRAYKKHLQEYHPDKVSHLGADLRRFAENRTKEIVIAYKLLESFYAD